jgi:sec-independent protein translocase protein TatA
MTAVILGAFGPMEMIPIVLALLLFFGGKKIPSLMKGLGQGIREFKDAKDGKAADGEKKLSSTND